MGIYRPTWIAENDLVIDELDCGVEELVIKPRGEVVVKVAGSFPDNMSDCSVSTRSCLAQAGGFFYLDSCETEYLTGRLVNKSGHGLIFRRGDSIGKVYFVNPEDCLGREDVRNLGLVEGIEGEDYRIGDDGTMEMRVAERRVYVPKQKYLRICSRGDLYAKTRTVRYDEFQDNSLFNLLETTAKVNIPDGVMGEILEETGIEGISHLPSRLIDPGSNWIVRLEVWGGRPEWIGVKFYRSEALKKINVRERKGTYLYCL